MSDKERKRKRKPYHLLSKQGKHYRRSLEDRDDSEDFDENDDEEFNQSIDDTCNIDSKCGPSFLEEVPSTSSLLLCSAGQSENSSNKPVGVCEINQNTENAAALSDSGDSSVTGEFCEYDFREEFVPEASISKSDNTFSFQETDESMVSETVSNVKEIEIFLKNWSIKHNITLSALSSLCAGLKENHPSCLSTLHSDARTILKTPTSVTVVDVPPGQYLHLGLQKQLLSIVQQLKSSNMYYDELSLLFNIDGLPLFHSSSGEVYPILFSIPSVMEIKNKVYPVGLYFGVKKPEEVSSFLREFLNELQILIENSLDFEDSKIKISVLGFCCDVPAKSFILGTISHTGYGSCTRCTVYGQTIENRRVFLESDCELRSHENFINRTDKTFQPRMTPLIHVPGLHFCKSFVLDYMHLICLGVMRTLMTIWCSGPLPLRLSPTQRSVISENLLSLRSDIPVEFARKPRETTYIKSWKATEWRMFLLYFGPIVLKDVINIQNYNHFLSLHVATTILLNPKMCSEPTLLDYAKKLLLQFVNGMRELYGDMYISHNFHNLLHIADDVEFFAEKIPNFSLNSIAAFPFENFMQTIKRKVRGHAKPLQQIGKRLFEEFESNIEKPLLKSNESNQVIFSVKHHDGPVPALCSNPQYKKAKFTLQDFEISTLHPNNCCRLRNGAIIVIENIAYSQELKKQVVVGKKFLKMENLFGKPLCESGELGTYKVSQLSQRKFWPLINIVGKCLFLKYNEKRVAVTLLHCETN